METSRKVGQQEIPQPQQGGNGSTLRPVVAALVGAGLLTPFAYAAPEGGTVVGGAAEIRTISATRTDVVQHTPRAIVDWRSFSIAPREHVDFQQPSTSASILNRVTGPQASELHGRLTANGNVYLVNPNGVVFGQNARLDVGSLIASTANISNESFMAGRLRFDRPGNQNARIVNNGQITVAEGGLAAFVAPSVENSGLISARLGKVMLAAGEAFTLDLYGDGMVSLRIDKEVAERISDSEGRPLANLINAGTIDAAGGTVLLTTSAAKTAVDEVINVGGVIRAQSVAEHNGEIVLSGGPHGTVAVSGVLNASGRSEGERGGAIEVSGEHVALNARARLDASGDSGGGTVLVGGAYRGSGAIQNALTTTVAEGASIAADALRAGNAGRVIVWADDITRYNGSISARGGSRYGDGGFVEVSAKRSLRYQGDVTLAAPRGQPGTLLLDPEDDLTVGLDLAKTLSRTLQEGAVARLESAGRIVIDARIDGRGGAESGALEISAGSADTLVKGSRPPEEARSSVVLNKDILTQNQPVTIDGGKHGVFMAPNKGDFAPALNGDRAVTIYAGKGDITLLANGPILTGELVTSGVITVRSRASWVDIRSPLGRTAPEAIRIEANDNQDAGLGNAVTIRRDRPIRARGDIIVSVPQPPSTGDRGAERRILLGAPLESLEGDIVLKGPVIAQDDVSARKGSIVVEGSLAIDPNTERGLVLQGTQTDDVGRRVWDKALRQVTFSAQEGRILITDNLGLPEQARLAPLLRAIDPPHATVQVSLYTGDPVGPPLPPRPLVPISKINSIGIAFLSKDVKLEGSFLGLEEDVVKKYGWYPPTSPGTGGSGGSSVSSNVAPAAYIAPEAYNRDQPAFLVSVFGSESPFAGTLVVSARKGNVNGFRVGVGDDGWFNVQRDNSPTLLKDVGFTYFSDNAGGNVTLYTNEMALPLQTPPGTGGAGGTVAAGAAGGWIPQPGPANVGAGRISLSEVDFGTPTYPPVPSPPVVRPEPPQTPLPSPPVVAPETPQPQPPQLVASSAFDESALAGTLSSVRASGADQSRSESAALEQQLFYSGRGVASSADLGRSGPSGGVAIDVFKGVDQVVILRTPFEAAEYFRTDSFGRPGDGNEIEENR